MSKTKRHQIRHDHLSNMRKRRKVETVDDPPSPVSSQCGSFLEPEPEPQSSLSESEFDSIDSAFKPEKEVFVLTVFDFYDVLIEDKNTMEIHVSCGTGTR